MSTAVDRLRATCRSGGWAMVMASAGYRSTSSDVRLNVSCCSGTRNHVGSCYGAQVMLEDERWAVCNWVGLWNSLSSVKCGRARVERRASAHSRTIENLQKLIEATEILYTKPPTIRKRTENYPATLTEISDQCSAWVNFCAGTALSLTSEVPQLPAAQSSGCVATRSGSSALHLAVAEVSAAVAYQIAAAAPTSGLQAVPAPHSGGHCTSCPARASSALAGRTAAAPGSTKCRASPLPAPRPPCIATPPRPRPTCAAPRSQPDAVQRRAGERP